MPGAGPERDVVRDASQILDVDPQDIPALKKTALEDPDPDRRLAAVTMLGASEDPEAVPVLAHALADSNEEVRMAALQELSDFTDEPPVDAIESALNDPAPDIRFEALSVLADVGGEPARLAIEKALNDPDEDVRNLAEGMMDLEGTSENQSPATQGQSGQGQPGHNPATK
jgi:HEAT repeat protein